MSTAILALPFGRLRLHTEGNTLLALSFQAPDTALLPIADDFQAEVARQLQAWCANPDHVFDLAQSVSGTAHQQRVWAAISAIPCGQTRRYGELAQSLQTSARAVGNACGRNPLPIVVPCHRVLARQGLGGFNRSQEGWLLDIKRWLLQHEQPAHRL